MVKKNTKKGNSLLTTFLIWRLKHISDNRLILIAAGLIGIIAGLAAVILKTLVHEISHFLESNSINQTYQYLHLIYPLIGILLTVLVANYITKEKLGHGITQILYAISKNSGILRRTQMYSRMVTSTITVGFGGSVGLEAPIVVTGSALGSNLSRLLHLNYKKRVLLIGCGAAGAVSAIFNSPVTGVIFALEVILTDVAISSFIPLLLASVCGQLISLVLLGENVLFSFQLKESFEATDTLSYLALGVVCGLVSLYFTRLIYFTEDKVRNISNKFNRSLIGGMGLAIIILLFPPLYGEGYATIKELLNGNASEISSGFFFQENSIAVIAFLLLILLVKPIATAITIGSGGSGGIFAPSLFVGGLTGFVFSSTYNGFFGTSLSTSNFTLVGMCGVMSGVLHAPLTAIFLIAEITSGYMLFVPLMLVSAISFSTIRYFEKYSIYTKNLAEAGDFDPYDKDKMVLSLIDLSKIIEKDLLKIRPEESLEELIQLVKRSRRNIFPVVNEHEELVGIVTLDDVREMMFDAEERQNVRIDSVMQKPPSSVATSESMQSVMNKFEITQAWNLPVIDENKYVGFISKSRIFNAYRTKLISQSNLT